MDSAHFKIYRLTGLNIAYYRNLRGMTQEQLGDKLNMEQSHISKIERAAVGISMGYPVRHRKGAERGALFAAQAQGLKYVKTAACQWMEIDTPLSFAPKAPLQGA